METDGTFQLRHKPLIFQLSDNTHHYTASQIYLDLSSKYTLCYIPLKYGSNSLLYAYAMNVSVISRNKDMNFNMNFYMNPPSTMVFHRRSFKNY